MKDFYFLFVGCLLLTSSFSILKLIITAKSLLTSIFISNQISITYSNKNPPNQEKKPKQYKTKKMSETI